MGHPNTTNPTKKGVGRKERKNREAMWRARKERASELKKRDEKGRGGWGG